MLLCSSLGVTSSTKPKIALEFLTLIRVPERRSLFSLARSGDRISKACGPSKLTVIVTSCTGSNTISFNVKPLANPIRSKPGSNNPIRSLELISVVAGSIPRTHKLPPNSQLNISLPKPPTRVLSPLRPLKYHCLYPQIKYHCLKDYRQSLQ